MGRRAYLYYMRDGENSETENPFAAQRVAKRAEKKRKKTVTVTDSKTGEEVQKEVTEAELAKLRLAKARALQEEKFRKMEEEARAAAEAAAAAKAAAENTEADK